MYKLIIKELDPYTEIYYKYDITQKKHLWQLAKTIKKIAKRKSGKYEIIIKYTEEKNEQKKGKKVVETT